MQDEGCIAVSGEASKDALLPSIGEENGALLSSNEKPSYAWLTFPEERTSALQSSDEQNQRKICSDLVKKHMGALLSSHKKAMEALLFSCEELNNSTFSYEFQNSAMAPGVQVATIY